MSPPRPEVLLIHGAWHIPASYAALTRALEASGLKVHIPPLPTASNKTPPTDDLYSDSAFIRSFVTGLLDKGTQLVVLMHSYGGQVGTNSLKNLGVKQRAAAGKPGGVLELIYMAAFAAPEGTSMTGWVDKMGQGDLMPLAFDFRDDGFVDSRFPRELLVGEGFLTAEEMEAYVGTFTTAVGQSWKDEVKESAWRELPVTYLMTVLDKTVPLEYQERFAEILREAGTEVRVERVDTGHCPNITATKEVAKIVVDVVDRVGGSA